LLIGGAEPAQEDDGCSQLVQTTMERFKDRILNGLCRSDNAPIAQFRATRR
jgi:hypothetical protein